MPQKCETISYCNPTPYREPRSRASCPPSVWRFDTMHLKPYPKLLEKEKRRESVHDATRVLHADQQGVIRTEWGIRQACGVMSSPGNSTANRCPLSIISPNSLRCRSNSDSTTPTRVSWTRKTKAPSITTFTSSLVLLSSLNGLENGDSLRIYQGEDEDGALDIWAVIKPGNTKEKIALFAAQKCGSTCNDSDGVDGVDNMCEQESISPELRSVSLKNKSCWDGDWSVAKRRRRSGNPDKPKGMDSPAPKPEMQRIFPSEVPSVNVSPCKVTLEDEEAEKTVSVVEMVAYLEQRVNNQLVSTKPPSLRSTSSITLSTQQSKDLEQPEVQEEEGESVRVLDMVAKLESQCLNGQVLREGGDLSRNNSLRRKVGRVLLAGSELYSLPSHSVSPTEKERTVQSETQELDSVLDKLTPSSHELEKTEISQCSVDSTTLHHDDGLCMAEQQASPDVEPTCNVQSLQRHSSSCGNEEPLPGMLFFIQKDQHSPPLPENTPQIKELNIHDSKPSVETLLSLREDNSEAYVAEQNHQNVESETSSVVSRESVPFPLRRLVSHEFLEMRFKIQLLLEPQQYMFFLPHHIIVKMFCLLPTESLAALKCTCQYFKFIIESYGVRPADSRWVSDPRYKDDPCKQCKRRYDRGDVSLCRWHHKPYCQALPYGPGYWMCCRGSQKDTPGCNVGLHDNHWVPAFHSINMPIYKKSRDMEEDS